MSVASDPRIVQFQQRTIRLTEADKTRDRRYKERQRGKGFAQVLVWVPVEAAPAIREIAANMRRQVENWAKEDPGYLGPPSGNTGGITPLEKHIKDQEEQ